MSLFPTHADDARTLLRLADLALYRAKRDGRNAVRLYEPGMEMGSTGPLANLTHANSQTYTD
jgi:predicted signal transduction protein with EAL and GGDEF domain